jgi:hypothetical protein
MRHRSLPVVLAVAALAAVSVVGISSADAAASKPAKAKAAAAGQNRPARPRPAQAPPFVKPAASYLGMQPAALMKQLKAKKTLASIAAAKGKSVDGLKDAIVADEQRHLDAQVTAGRLTQEEADARIADFTEHRVDDIVSKPLPANGGGNCPRPGGGAGGGGNAAGGTGTATGNDGYGTGTGGTSTNTGTTNNGTYL